MITTITLNAAIDKTYFVEGFELGQVSRVKKMYATPGGKGINVARVLKQLGADVVASGFVGGNNGAFIQEELQRQGIEHDFVTVSGESRLCLNMIDPTTATSTEVLEPGPEITAESLQAMKAKVEDLAGKSSTVVFSGSLPAGVPDDYYAELIRVAKAKGAKVLLDSSKAPLLQGIKAVPHFIKPNEDEVKALLGAKSSGVEDELLEQILTLNDQGIDHVVVTLGAGGSLAGVEGQLYRIHAPKIEVVNTVGCGDSFVAGMAFAMERCHDVETSLCLATATGSANALTERAGYVHLEDVDRLEKQVVIERIED